MILISEILKKYLASEFLLDLMEITLTQRGTEKPLVLQGRGIVTFGKKYPHFALRMYSDLGQKPPPGMGKWPGSEKVDSGNALPAHHFFDFEATDLHGEKWHCEEITVQPIAGRGVVFTCNMPTLTCVSPSPMQTDCNQVTLYFLGNLEIPFTTYVERKSKAEGKLLHAGMSLEHHESEAGGFDFVASRVEKHRDVRFIRVASLKSALVASAETRINEALSYALARPLQAPISERWQGEKQTVTLRPLDLEKRELDLPGRFEPPVSPNSIFIAKDFWNLFSAYFVYAAADPIASRPHPLSHQLLRVLLASRSSLDMTGLVVCTAVEGLLKLNEFSDIPFPVSEDASEHHGNCSSVKMVRNLAPINKLRTLQQHGLVSKVTIKAWEYLRHRTAHGEMSIDERREQEFARASFSVYELLNRLVFLVIQYQGEHTDFSKSGWPNEHFHGGHFQTLRLQWKQPT